MAKLWEKGYSLDRSVERFTVGRDYLLDRRLIVADAAASIAHVRSLAAIEVLPAEEAEAIERELRAIARDGFSGRIEITPEDEDCHTVIEARLTDKLGALGSRVHTGRSRNDQVTAATRLYTRESLIAISEGVLILVTRLLERAEQEEETVMPGRTHLQVAMLTTFGHWLASWAELFMDDLAIIETYATLNDRNPLGSAASYGVPLPLDRERSAAEMGFAGVQNNTLAVQHSRGALDAGIVGALAALSTSLGRMAQDLMLFTLPELGYVRLPVSLCSGSSIMPQKKNPDVLELLRARAGVVDGWASQCRAVVRSLPSGYNRDLQDTKEPLLRALEMVEEELEVAWLVIDRLQPDRERMRDALDAELFATDYVYKLVRDGVPFREAYRRAATEYGDTELPDPEIALTERSSTGAPGNPNFKVAKDRAMNFGDSVYARRERHERAVRSLLGDLESLRPQRSFRNAE